MGSTRRKVTEQFTIYCPPVHALLYAFLSSKKSFNPSSTDCILLISNGKAYEALPFQIFTARVHISIAYFLISRRFPGVKVCFLRPLQAFTARVNVLKSNPSHQKPLKIRMKHALCEGGECFFGEINTYIRVRKGHIQNRWRLIQHDRTASLVRPDVT